MERAPSWEDIVESMGSGMIAADAAGRIVSINGKASKMLDLPASGAWQVDIRRLLPEAAHLLEACLRSAENQLGCYVQRKDGKFALDICPIKIGGNIEGLVVTLQRLDNLEQALRNSDGYVRISKQLDAIFKGTSDGLWVQDSQGKIININTVSEMINGIRARDVIGKSIHELVEEGIFEGVVTPEILRTKRQFSTLSYVKKTGKRVLVTGTPILDEGGNVTLIVCNERDLTHWNAVKEDLERSRKVAEKYKDEFEELSRLESGQHEIVAESRQMKQILRVSIKLARMGASNILIQGESGTGKGLIAKFIHDNGRRKPKPFIQINCAALPESLLEAELFGYEKGAFTGAREQGKIGLFELAHEGTLFLDEIGDLPLSVQAKLLKYLDDHEILPLGGIRRKKVDCTVIAATNQDLSKLTEQKRFRQDLFFRLNTFKIQIPPLRRRKGDILKMIDYFLDKYNEEYQVRRRITAQAIHRLQAYPYPGNVRELQNIIREAVVLSDTAVLDDFLAGTIGAGEKAARKKIAEMVNPAYPIRLQDKIQHLEKEILSDAFTRFRSTRKIAQNLGTSQSSIMRKMRKYGLA
jgi:PAS domain S-box-containing protein/TyrR family helix-turn-helix protein